MVYTIVGQLPFIKSDESKRRFFKIFLFGSLIYILLHYYLFLKDQDGILENVKNYLYYGMAIDLCLAYTLDKFLAPIINENDDKEDLDENTKSEILPSTNSNVKKFQPTEKEELEKRYEILKLKNQQQKIQEQLEERKEMEQREQREQYVKELKLKSEEEISLPKPKKQSQIHIQPLSEESNRSNKSSRSNKSNQENQEDTDIPRFAKK